MNRLPATSPLASLTWVVVQPVKSDSEQALRAMFQFDA